MPEIPVSRRGGLAVHEAAHAVAAVNLGLGFREVSIVGTSRYLGISRDDRSAGTAEARAVASLAGPFAEEAFFRRSGQPTHERGNAAQDEKDFRGEIVLLSSGGLPSVTTDAKLRAEARDYVERPLVRLAIEVLAEVLLRRETLNAAEVRVEAWGRWPWPSEAEIAAEHQRLGELSGWLRPAARKASGPITARLTEAEIEEGIRMGQRAAALMRARR